MLGAPTMPLNSVYRGNTRFWNREIVWFNGGTSHHEGTCHGCVISLGHKMESDCVCVCAHGGGWWKKDREKERKREGKRERLSPCQSGDWGQTCIIRFTMTRCYYSIFHVLTLSVQTYTQEDSNPTHSALLSNKSTQTSTLILTESETIPCLTWEKSHLKENKHTTNSTALFPFNIPLKSSTSRLNLYYITSMHYFYENVLTCFY